MYERTRVCKYVTCPIFDVRYIGLHAKVIPNQNLDGRYQYDTNKKVIQI